MATTNDTKPLPHRRAMLAAAALAIGMAATAASATRAITPARPIVELDVVDRETGETARVYRHQGRAYVAGRPGARYSLRVTNNTGGRVLAVMSVDGVNILTGETAGHGQRGYVFGPYESYEVSGWRKSDREVAAFTFAPLSRSYAARTGRPNDVGVIGVAAFTERRRPVPMEAEAAQAEAPMPPPPPPAAAPRARSAAAGADAAARPEPSLEARRSERLGTGHGARERSDVVTVAFERATTYPQLVRQLEYDSYANLVAAGVIPRAGPPAPRPRPFPGSGYVPDPPRGG